MNTFVLIGLCVFSVGFLLQLLPGLRYKEILTADAPTAENVVKKYRRTLILGKMLFYTGITLSIFTVTV